MAGNFDLQQELRAMRRRLKAIPAVRDLASTFGRLADELGRDRLRVGVVGITSSGKSTFLNALLGCDLLPEQAKATTNMLVYCRRGPQLQANIFHRNRSEKRLRGKEVNLGNLTKYCAEDQNPHNKKQVERIEILSPSMRLPEQFELVDTPGLDAYGLQEHEELTLRQFLPEADIVLYTTSIRNPLKKADARLLEKILQNDQRVVFVQTCKDVEEDTVEKHVVVMGREEKLRKHFLRLQIDVRHCSPTLKACGFAQVSSRMAKKNGMYAQSGFEELLESVRGFAHELSALIGDRLAARVERHVDISLSKISEIIFRIQGNAEAERLEQEKRVERRTVLEQCRSDLDNKMKAAEGVWLEKLEENELVGNLIRSLPNRGSDADYEEKWLEKREAVQKLLPEMLSQLDATQKVCEEILRRTGLDPYSYDSRSLEGLPSAPTPEWRTTTRVETERVWWTLWIWKREKKVTENRLDRDKARKALEQYGTQVCSCLRSYMGWWRQYCTNRYSGPITAHIDDLGRADAELPPTTSVDLGLLQGVQERLIQIKERLRTRQMAARPEPRTPNPENQGAPNGYRRAPVIGRLLYARRDLAFHDLLLRRVAAVTKSEAPLLLLTLGGKASDHEIMGGILRHSLGDGDSVDNAQQFNIFCDPEWEPPPFLVNLRKTIGLNPEKRLIWSRVTLLTCPNGLFLEDTFDWDGLFGAADAVVLFVNCPQINSGINDLVKSPWKEALTRQKHKIIYWGFDMSYFRDGALHRLPTEVLPVLFQNSPFGERPYAFAQEYEIRYTYVAEYGSRLLHTCKSTDPPTRRTHCRIALDDWKHRRIPVHAPFTEEVLSKTFEDVLAYQD